MSKPILNILNSIAATPSKNEKLRLLMEQKDNQFMQTLCRMSYSNRVRFWQKVTRDTLVGSGSSGLTCDHLADIERLICNREITGNAARDYIQNLATELNPEGAEILYRMISRDLDIGMGIGTINKVWSGLVAEFPCMLAEKFDAKNAKEFYKIDGQKDSMIVQLKEDGGRCQLVVTEDSVTGYSRAGNELTLHGQYDYLSKTYAGFVIDGEIRAKTPMGKYADRKTSNGIYNKAVRNTLSVDEAKTLHFIIWDIIPIDDFYSGICVTPCIKRLQQLTGVHGYNISIVPSKIISTVAEAEKFYSEMLSRGEEGAMLKLANSPWEDKRSRSVLKLKEEQDATLICYATTKHSKNPEWIGSLECRTACGELETSIGSGMTEDDRKKDPSEYIGSFIDMKYNQLIKSKSNEKWSMFLPIFRGIRVDVTQADTLKKLK